ncbi:MAG TPA: hypothetical protein VK206_21925, partial [Anaerolineales bacterium]|nr:hypothetical protein [Anaerolineales bacterium]
MSSYAVVFIIIALIIAAWYGWRYYKLRHDIDEYANRARGQDINTNIKELENLSSAITSLIS